ncbi:MAG: YihY/virulence factor BrkB family protein, partial [Vicinamibacterales bacterium]
MKQRVRMVPGTTLATSVLVADMFGTFSIPLSWRTLAKRSVSGFIEDDCLSLAAQLAYYFFLALFPTLLFLLALASFFSLGDVANRVVEQLGPFVPPDVVRIVADQIVRISSAEDGGILTLGIAGALWSSSAALVSIVGSLNAAYDITEGRPWWKVRLVAVGLTLALAAFMLLSLGLVLAGPE